MTTPRRLAFGAEFVGAAGYSNSASYGLPPAFLVDAMNRCLGEWQMGSLDVPSFDESVRRGRNGWKPVSGAWPGRGRDPGRRQGDHPGGEFTSTSFPFAAQVGRGVTVTEATADGFGDHHDRRRDPGGRLEEARSRLGRRDRRSGLQVADGAPGYGVDVVERQGDSPDDPARRELVRQRGTLVDDLRSAAGWPRSTVPPWSGTVWACDPAAHRIRFATK